MARRVVHRTLHWKITVASMTMLACVLPRPPGGGSAAADSAPAGAACRGTEIRPDADVHAALAAGPEGATFCFRPGTYRLDGPLQPKAKQRLIGTRGVVLNGAKLISGFAPDGPNFVASGFLPSTPSTHGECTVSGCTYTQDIFVNNVRLSRVTSAAELAPGRFYEDFGHNKIYLRDNPHGLSVEQAYAPSLVRSSNGGITVTDLALEKAANEAQTAAVMADGPGWTVEYNEVRLNHGQGINCANCVVRHNLVHWNGQLGLAGHDGGKDLVENNEVAHNNSVGYDPVWEGGGAKWWAMTGLVVRGNYVHHNHGPGLWTDTNNRKILYEDNYVSENDEHGIFQEIGYAATIRNNIIVGNGFHLPKDLDGWGGVGIRIAASPRVEIYGNKLIGNRNGIVAIQQLRTEAADAEGPHEVAALTVRDNDVSMTVGVSGLVQDVGDSTYFTSRGNRFTGNHYHLDASDALRFTWGDADHNSEGWKQVGNDKTGTFDTAIPAIPAPPAMSVGPRSDTRSAGSRTRSAGW